MYTLPTESRTTPNGSRNRTSSSAMSWPTMSKYAEVWPVGMEIVNDGCGTFVSVHVCEDGSSGLHGATNNFVESLDVIVTGIPPIGAGLGMLTECVCRTPV